MPKPRGIVMSAEQMKERAERLLEALFLQGLLTTTGNAVPRFPVTITGSAENLCDPSIDIIGVSVAAVEIEVQAISGPVPVQAFQVYTVEYIPAMRGPNGDPGDPPDEDTKEHGEPHRSFDVAMVEVIKLLVENELNSFMESEGDDYKDPEG
jgi:hypothetical protein